MTARSVYAIGLSHARRLRTILFASVGLIVLLAALTAGILLTQQQAKSRISSSFSLRGTSSASFVSTYLTEQASREQQAARRFLAGPHVSASDFKLLAATLGGGSAVLLDGSGRVLDSYPAVPALRDQAIAGDYAHLRTAERGGSGFSGLVYSPVTGTAGTAIATSFATAAGRRVLSVDYPASNLALNALVDHTISYPQHEVFLLDPTQHLIAASPRTEDVTLAQLNPGLARAAKRSSEGPVLEAAKPSTFTAAPVSGTGWRLLIAVPNSRLYSSVAGWTELVPWLVLALVTVLGGLLIALFGRSLADRARLTALSQRMERTAQTDSLTNLNNRRALTEQLTRISARARRYEEPLSVLMIDLDRFKQTNDSYGHEAGDQVLCTVADCMRDVLRAEDVYGRWGGDEFLVALPKTDGAGAHVTAERLRAAAARVDLSDIGLPDGVALSVGVASGVHTSPHDLVREADLALYAAKAEGRVESVLQTG